METFILAVSAGLFDASVSCGYQMGSIFFEKEKSVGEQNYSDLMHFHAFSGQDRHGAY